MKQSTSLLVCALALSACNVESPVAEPISAAPIERAKAPVTLSNGDVAVVDGWDGTVHRFDGTDWIEYPRFEPVFGDRIWLAAEGDTILAATDHRVARYVDGAWQILRDVNDEREVSGMMGLVVDGLGRVWTIDSRYGDSSGAWAVRLRADESGWDAISIPPSAPPMEPIVGGPDGLYFVSARLDDEYFHHFSIGRVRDDAFEEMIAPSTNEITALGFAGDALLAVVSRGSDYDLVQVTASGLTRLGDAPRAFALSGTSASDVWILERDEQYELACVVPPFCAEVLVARTHRFHHFDGANVREIAHVDEDEPSPDNPRVIAVSADAAGATFFGNEVYRVEDRP